MLEIRRGDTDVVLCRIDNALSFEGLNLYGANLRAAYLGGGKNLTGANLASADLSSANLSNAILVAANLRYTNLSRADLHGADLTGAELSGANLELANFQDVILNKADLKHIKDYGLKLEGAIYDQWTRWPLNFDPESLGARMVGATVSANAMRRERPWWRFW